MVILVQNILEMKDITDLNIFTVKDGETFFDFNKIFPMPEKLDLFDGTLVLHSIVYRITERMTIPYDQIPQETVDFIIKNYPSFQLERNYHVVQQYITWFNDEKRCDQIYDFGQKYLENLKDYGFPEGREWRRKNWGTVKNSSFLEIVCPDEIKFKTHETIPLNIISKLSELYPEEDINLTSYGLSGKPVEHRFKNGEIEWRSY